MNNKKVLIIDDDEAILEALELAVIMEGYEVEITPKIENIMSKIDLFKPDIIILDVLLCGADGRHVCQNLKNNLRTQNIPILMISAHPTAAKTVKSFGADDFLAKPFDIENFLGRIQELISR